MKIFRNMNWVLFIGFMVISLSDATAGKKGYTTSGKELTQLYNEGVRFFKQGKLREAQQSLSSFIRNHYGAHDVEEATVLLTNIYLRQRHLDSAQTLIHQFKRHFGKSAYLPRMVYYQGLIYLGLQQHYDAARMFSEVINATGSSSLFNSAKDRLLQMVNGNFLNEDEMQNIIEKLRYDRELLSRFLIHLGDLQVKNYRYKAARISYEMWIHHFTGSSETSAVKNKLSSVRQKEVPFRTILVMIPLTGFNRDVGQSLLEGMLLVLDSLVYRSKGTLRYKILDTKGDPITAINRLRRAVQEEEVGCILGPAMSDVCIAVAAELSNGKSRIPMISPTATTRGISALGNGIFQINVTTFTLGQHISKYAMKCLNLKDFAILAPNNEYGLDLSRAFESTVEAHNGRIIAKEFYSPEAKDYAGHFQVIRRRIVQELLEDKWIRRGKDPNTIPRKTIRTWTADSVLNLDGIFIAAANGEEAFKLVSQARYHKLRSKILGSSGWYDKRLFHKGLRNTRDIAFSIGFILDEKSGKWTDFKKQYKERWNTLPNRVSILGHDAALFAEAGLVKGPQKDLISNLRRINTLEGIQGTIIFNIEEGYNNSATIVKLGKRNFEKAEWCKED
jgi:ABC-type branched-subunit amino acid transport system substrate-binding protein